MKPWREAASLILAASNAQKYNHTASLTIHNYNLLCLKRHQNSSFYAGTYVFPGGAIDPSDADLKWRELFANFGFDDNSFASLRPKIVTPIFQPRPNELPREISLRITAIRETFEECGVLMCRHKRDAAASSNWIKEMSVPKSELELWRNKVHNDAKEFITLCEKFKCYPDLWALHEWGNWITPTIFKKRFDTIFYLACMPYMPHAEYQASELQDLKWENPENIMSSKDFALPPPQHYEITRLTNFKDIDGLLEFAMKCEKGVQLYLPVHIHLKDGMVSVLPGDTFYPKEVNLSHNQIINKSDITMDEFREATPIKHRFEYDKEVAKIIKVFFEHNKENEAEFKFVYGEESCKNKL
ncbi:nucleoside diphosphate-linked moiety X motif 19-like [Pseudomyrmex gracilis]|uniref:nucleoside diphosphate-linked moiety X motif 19-like n=1 Tax=Pseudomyrmex gracilis TaxID=219809 RepID=UPI0009951020|nr:nucleoside diphosphate-linked moiety X motif 19-like [Pseudomyrmex gracilis]